MSIHQSTRKSMEQWYAREYRRNEQARMMKELMPLYYLWGEEKYNEWVETWISESMSVDEIIRLAHLNYPECTCNPLNEPCPGCRDWARIRAAEKAAQEAEND